MSATKTYNCHQIYGILKNYFWMMKEIKRLDAELNLVEFNGTAQYGITATLPHAVGIVGRALENEVVRRSKKSERMLDYAHKVNFINERLGKVTDEKEKVVLDCMLDGMNLVAIAHHLKISRKQVHILRDTIVNRLAD
jgi:hypothetical protein